MSRPATILPPPKSLAVSFTSQPKQGPVTYAEHLQQVAKITAPAPTLRMLRHGEYLVYPTSSQLAISSPFGKPSRLHSYTAEPTFSTVVVFLLKSNFLTEAMMVTLFEAYPLVYHLYKMMHYTAGIDFSCLREPNRFHATQQFIPLTRITQMMALAMHYNFDVPSMIRFLSGNYTRNHLDVPQIIDRLQSFGVPPDIVADVQRIYTLGSPSAFNVFDTAENIMKYRLYGNHSSITQHLDAVLAAISKEERYSYSIPLPKWMFVFFHNVHCNPQGIITLPGKNPRTISDGSFRPDADAISVNQMHGNEDEPELVYGRAFLHHLIGIYNHRITYADDVIYLFDDDVAAAFRLPKCHPDVAGAFCHIVCGLLLLSAGQTFGSNFSPHNFEPLARARQHVAEALATVEHSHLIAKHHEFINRVVVENPYPPNRRIARVQADALNPGSTKLVRYNMYVDDNLYAATLPFIHLAMAASIESNYIVFGAPDASTRRDTINDEKFYSTTCSPVRRQLGLIVDTTDMMVRIPSDKIDGIRTATEHFHDRRRCYTLRQGASLVGSIGHVASVCPWIRHLSILLRLSVYDGVRINQQTTHQLPFYKSMV